MAILTAGRGRRLAIPRPVNWPLWAAVVAGLVAGEDARDAAVAASGPVGVPVVDAGGPDAGDPGRLAKDPGVATAPRRG